MIFKKDNGKSLIIGINLCDYGSTGNMMINSLKYAEKHGNFDVAACIPYQPKSNHDINIFSFNKKNKIQLLLYKISNKLGHYYSNDGNHFLTNTFRLIRYINNKSKNYKYVIIHMHNIHDCNLNINFLFKYLIRKKFNVLYTLHDCWSFTGGCYVYDFIKCNKWQNNCKNCPQNYKFTSYQLKKRTLLLNKIPNLKLIPVSKWANNEIKKSRLKNIDSIVNLGESSLNPLSNTIPKQTITNNDNKKILLFVSAYWNNWKGVEYIYKIAELVPQNYILVVVGPFDVKEYKNIINIKEANIDELPYYYKKADVYVSVTQADQLGLTTCEAQMCGTPIVGFGHGGSLETFIDGKTGFLVHNNNVQEMVERILFTVENKPFDKNDIMDNGNRFSKNEHAKRQLSIYKKTIEYACKKQ